MTESPYGGRALRYRVELMSPRGSTEQHKQKTLMDGVLNTCCSWATVICTTIFMAMEIIYLKRQMNSPIPGRVPSDPFTVVFFLLQCATALFLVCIHTNARTSKY